MLVNPPLRSPTGIRNRAEERAALPFLSAGEPHSPKNGTAQRTEWKGIREDRAVTTSCGLLRPPPVLPANLGPWLALTPGPSQLCKMATQAVTQCAAGCAAAAQRPARPCRAMPVRSGASYALCSAVAGGQQGAEAPELQLAGFMARNLIPWPSIDKFVPLLTCRPTPSAQPSSARQQRLHGPAPSAAQCLAGQPLGAPLGRRPW